MDLDVAVAVDILFGVAPVVVARVTVVPLVSSEPATAHVAHPAVMREGHNAS